jgi:hypothetical protein
MTAYAATDNPYGLDYSTQFNTVYQQAAVVDNQQVGVSQTGLVTGLDYTAITGSPDNNKVLPTGSQTEATHQVMLRTNDANQYLSQPQLAVFARTGPSFEVDERYQVTPEVSYITTDVSTNYPTTTTSVPVSLEASGR